MESYVIPMDVGAGRDSALSLIAAQEGGLTQGLVVVVILIVIALALILICGLLGRREEARPSTAVRDEPEAPSAAGTGSQVVSSVEPAAPVVAAEAVEAVQEEDLGATETAAEPVEGVEAVSLVEETVVEPAIPSSQPDDLKRIEGIGPKVSGLLNESGIFTFAQLAGTDVDRLRTIVDDAGLAMMNPASWPEQARLAAAGEWDALASLQDELKGGRRS